MPTIRTKAFKTGNSIAVRLPKEVAFEEGAELVVERNGDVMTIYPARRKTPADLVAELRKLPRPPYIEERDTEEIPEPKGL
jgi:antitoxin VapB